jgi:hypothetical protein
VLSPSSVERNRVERNRVERNRLALKRKDGLRFSGCGKV